MGFVMQVVVIGAANVDIIAKSKSAIKTIMNAPSAMIPNTANTLRKMSNI